MPTPQFVEEKPVSLTEVQDLLEKIQKRDIELNYLSNKLKEYLSSFEIATLKQKEELSKKLKGLELTRLKEEHLVKIIDFLPQSEKELKIVLQAYPLSMSKKDMDSIVEVVKGVVKE